MMTSSGQALEIWILSDERGGWSVHTANLTRVKFNELELGRAAPGGVPPVSVFRAMLTPQGGEAVSPER